MSTLPSRYSRRSVPQTSLATSSSPTYVIFEPRVTLFLVLARIYWFLASFVPVVSAIMITYALWSIMEDIHTISTNVA